ncbi:MAG TPA: 5'-nucleotidase C-terminal domain-containing protein [Pyrinomonadaceae bacterium]|jgi:5'-nucleotidase
MIFQRLLPRRAALALMLALVAALSVAAQTAQERIVRLTLLQVNDVYSFLPVDRGASGGIARLMTLRKKLLAEQGHTLFLLGGDTISPSVESNTFKGRQMIDAWNAAGLDYSVFGNHEFDFGPETLRERIKESRFVWLGANVIDKKTRKPFGDTPAFVIREFDGIRVGIFGLVLPKTKETSRPGPDVEFQDVCQTAQRIVPEMRAQGAQVIIAMTHLTMGEDKAVARCAPIDVIIGGHEHTLLESLSGRTPIFKMASDARQLGRITLNIKAPSGQLESIDWEVIPVTNEIAPDPSFAAITEKYKDLLTELAERVGQTDVELDAGSEANRTGETNVGNFVADAFRQVTGADVALINGGSIRADAIISPGELTKRDVLAIFPFANPVVKLEVTGATLRAALEHGVSSGPEETEPGRFPQVSGIRFTFDPARPAGSRLTEVTVNGQPLDDKKTYTLATSTFLAVDGGDGYTMFRGARFLIKAEQAQKAPDVLSKAIASVKAIAPRTDGRITKSRSQKPEIRSQKK